MPRMPEREERDKGKLWSEYRRVDQPGRRIILGYILNMEP